MRGEFKHPNFAYAGQFGVDAKPCPFCASHNVGVSLTHRPHVSCVDCGADGPQAERGADPRVAVEIWNART